MECLAALYNRVRKLQTPSADEDSNETSLHGIAFASLVSYLEGFRDCESVAVFKLVELAKLYSAKLQELGITSSSKITTTRLKERLLGAFLDLSAHTQGRDVLLIFSGTFPPDCQAKCVPESLKALVDMIIEGPSIKKTAVEENPSKMACLTIAELLAFDSTRHSSKGNSPAYSRHSREREYPLPIYMALKIHGETRKKSLIDAFFNMGLCISYDRVLAISTDTANSVTTRFEQDGVVCPPELRGKIFTTAGVDTIDHNPSSTTAHDSFHGTAISLVQHPTTPNKGNDRSIPVLNETAESQRKIAQLSEMYTNVQPAVLQVKEPFAPPVVGPLKPRLATPERIENEYEWSNHLRELLGKETLEKDDYKMITHTPAIISLLPMFSENVHSVAMILHSMNVIKSAV